MARKPSARRGPSRSLRSIRADQKNDVPLVTMKDIEDDVVSYAEKKAEAQKLGKEIDDLSTSILAGLDTLDIDSVVAVGPDGLTHTAKRVQGQRTSIDEGSLKKRVGARVWKTITTLVLDRKKLEAAIAAGDIDENIVASCSTTHDNKPYVRLTSKKA